MLQVSVGGVMTVSGECVLDECAESQTCHDGTGGRLGVADVCVCVQVRV